MALPAVENYTTTAPDGVALGLARYAVAIRVR